MTHSTYVQRQHDAGLDDPERIAACINFCRNFDTDFLASRTAVNLRAQGFESLADLPGFDGLMAIVKNQG